MRVHIVAGKDEWVLWRLASLLSEKLGWSISHQPDPQADVNYFFPYLNYVPAPTKTAAWFTHHDENRQGKRQRWHEVAAAVDLRLTSAKQYMSSLGSCSLVTPPIDEQFKPESSVKGSDKPVVGIAGMNYRDGRKGEDLVTRLAKSDLPMTLKASGRGWRIPNTQHYSWSDMPAFYQSLDILLCTSRVEGIPMPPLEALACGIPVVIPRGVGLLDELPNHPGVYRFEAGDYDSMTEALQLAISEIHETRDFGDIVAGYTAEMWCKTHLEAFSAFVESPSAVTIPQEPELLPAWEGKAGVYYVAYGEQARACAVRAINSWKEHMPAVPVALVSDMPLGLEDVFIQQPDRDIGGRINKILIDSLAPEEWQYILYLDADTEVTAEVSLFFKLLADGWEFVICKEPGKYVSTSEMKRPDNQEEIAATYKVMGTENAFAWNGGVWAYRRNARTKAFFERWMQEWNRWGKRDQGALLRALWADPLKVYTLGNEWNCIDRYMDVSQCAGIRHYPMEARRWKGLLPERLDDPAVFKRVIKP